MATETRRNVDPEIINLSGGLFDGVDRRATDGPLIDITVPRADRAPGSPFARARCRPAVRGRAGSASWASWVVLAALGAVMTGGLAAASQISSSAARSPESAARPDVDADTSAVLAVRPAPPVEPTADADVPEASPEIEACFAVCSRGREAPPLELPKARSVAPMIRNDGPARPREMAAVPPAATAENPLAALAARETDFSRPAAAVAIASAAHGAGRCKAPGDPRATLRVRVTFAASGRATSAAVTGGPFVGTPIGSCIATALRAAAVRPFDGEPVTVSTSVSLR